MAQKPMLRAEVYLLQKTVPNNVLLSHSDSSSAALGLQFENFNEMSSCWHRKYLYDNYQSPAKLFACVFFLFSPPRASKLSRWSTLIRLSRFFNEISVDVHLAGGDSSDGFTGAVAIPEIIKYMSFVFFKGMQRITG